MSKRDKVAREVNHVSSKLFGRVCGAMMMVLDLLGKGMSKTQDVTRRKASRSNADS